MRLGSLNIKDNKVSFDTETTGINGYGEYKYTPVRGYPARPFEFTFCDTEGGTADIRFDVNPKTRKVIYSPRELKGVQEILEDPHITKIGFNLSFDVRMSRFAGMKVLGEYEDAMYLAHVFTGGDEIKYDLKGLSEKMLNYPQTDEKELKEAAKQARTKGKKLGWCLGTKEFHGKEPIKADYWMADPKLCSKYAVQDAERTMLLFQSLWNSAKNDPNMVKTYRMEMDLLRVVESMEHCGTRVFPEDLIRLREFYIEYRDKQQKEAEADGGKGLNYKSPKQMVEVFINKRGYEPLTRTATGLPQVNGDFLKHLAEVKEDKLAKAILEYRGAAHMITGFLDPYERFKVKENELTYVLHPNYRQCGPVTGRFSCGDPNLMQVASPTTGRKRTDITLRPREAFGPREGYVWYMPDYSQIEVWVFSFLAQEQAMMKALLEGRDFHSAVAQQIWGNEEIYKTNPDYVRKRAKLLMFCKLYGGGANKVAYLTDSSVEDARKFVDDFNEKLPGVSRFMNQMVNKAVREGRIQNPFGRYYYIQPNFAYKAVNYLVQGSSADILKRAMIRIHELFQERWKGCHILLTLHDELIMEVPLEYHSKKLMREIMQEMQRDSAIVNVPVPLPVGMKIATKRWAFTKEIDSLKQEWKDTYLCKVKN